MKLKIFVICGILLVSSACIEQSSVHSVKQVDLEEMTIAALQKGYATGIFTIEDVISSYLTRIDSIDATGPRLNSVIQMNPAALELARTMDKELQAGHSRGILHGIPIILKDNIDTDNMPTTAGSRALEGSMPLQNSAVTQQLIDAGAIILAKANLSEWANFRGSPSTSGWSGLNGQTKNPYILDRNPCGSSAGSGVSVSANLTALAIGTETNGSIVCPASQNGVVGIKPTVGLISRTGIIPISYTQDTAGPMARTVTDAVICLNALTAIDSSDLKTLDSHRHVEKDYTKFLRLGELKGKRIGLYKPPLGKISSVDSVFYVAVDYLKAQGVEVVEVDHIGPKEMSELSFEIMLQEYGEGLNAYFKSLGPTAKIKSLTDLIAFNKSDSIELRYFDQRIFEMAIKKEGMSSELYQSTLAKMLQGARQEGIDKVMTELKLDAIMAPTGGPAWKTNLETGDRFGIGSSSPAAVAGYPNITVPMGFVDQLPVGISFFGRAWSEASLIEIAYGYEQGTMHRKAPNYLTE